MNALQDENIGKKFGRLTIIDFKFKKGNHKYYLCECDCGNKKNVCYTHLIQGNILSCGCLKKELDLSKLKYDGASRFLYRQYKRNSKYKKREFNLSYEDFLEITSQNCFYCGQEPRLFTYKNRSNYFYNGVDRKDNSKGYIKENIVPCCPTCNYFKSDMDYEKFLNLIRKIYEFKFKNK